MRYRFDHFTLDTKRFDLYQDSTPIHVEPQVIELIVFLIENRDRMISKQEMNEKIWGGRVVSDAALSSRIKTARQTLGDDGRNQRIIKTIHKKGFRFVAEVKIEPESGDKNLADHNILTNTSKLPETYSLLQTDLTKPSIAVLPFTNLSNDPEQEYFSDGITDDIITLLSQFSNLLVIARNSSFSFKGQSVGPESIAAELSVRYLLEGSIRRSGDRIRINTQLLDTSTGSYVWTESFDRSFDDVFELQDEITRNIVSSIAPQIEIAELERGRRLPSENLNSYEHSLKAQALLFDGLSIGDMDYLQSAIDVAQQALDTDPRNSHALFVQSFTCLYLYLYRHGPDPESTLDRAWQISEHFTQVDSSNPKAMMVRGATNQLRGNHDAAIADYRRAYSLNPNLAMNLFIMAWGESLAGLTEDAREHALLGLRLSPRDLNVWLGEAYLALTQASFAEADYEETIKWGTIAIQLAPSAPIRRTLLIASHAYLDNAASVKQNLEELDRYAPDFLSDILSSKLVLYKFPEHNQKLIDGLIRAGCKI